MEDAQIIQLFFDRSEAAITETDKKYGKYCNYIAYHILYSVSDAEECVSDAYLRLWNIIPPQRPTFLKPFIGRITRNFALNKYRYDHAQKRDTRIEEAMEELYPCLQGKEIAPDEDYILKELIDQFLKMLPKRNRIIFLQRYWYFCSIKEIAENLDLEENNVKVILSRVRKQFKKYLKKEGALK